MDELTNIPLYANIDGVNYEIKKLKFANQVRLASIISKTLTGMSLDLGNPEDAANGKAKKAANMNIDMGTIMQKCPEVIPQVLAMGLGIDLKIVEEFEDSDQALHAFEEILKMNPVDKIMGKSLALLQNIKV